MQDNLWDGFDDRYFFIPAELKPIELDKVEEAQWEVVRVDKNRGAQQEEQVIDFHNNNSYYKDDQRKHGAGIQNAEQILTGMYPLPHAEYKKIINYCINIILNSDNQMKINCTPPIIQNSSKSNNN